MSLYQLASTLYLKHLRCQHSLKFCPSPLPGLFFPILNWHANHLPISKSQYPRSPYSNQFHLENLLWKYLRNPYLSLNHLSYFSTGNFQNRYCRPFSRPCHWLQSCQTPKKDEPQGYQEWLVPTMNFLSTTLSSQNPLSVRGWSRPAPLTDENHSWNTCLSPSP